MNLLDETVWNSFKQFELIFETGAFKNSFILQIRSMIDQIIEKYKVRKCQLPCPSLASSLLHLAGRHVTKIVPPTGKKRTIQQLEVQV